MPKFNTDFPKKFEVFKKVLSKYVDNLDIYGIKFKYTDKTIKRGIQLYDVEVPVIQILNPNDIPFSYNSLHDLFSTEISTVNRFTNTFDEDYLIEKSFSFDDFNVGNFYIPSRVESDLFKCLHNNSVEIKYRAMDIIYTITGEFIVDDSFEIYWNDYESFNAYCTFKVKNVFVDNLSTNKFYNMDDKDDMTSLVNEIYYQDNSVFENPIWHCFEDTLFEYTTFINREWQYIDIRPIPI